MPLGTLNSNPVPEKPPQRGAALLPQTLPRRRMADVASRRCEVDGSDFCHAIEKKLIRVCQTHSAQHPG